MLDGLCRPYRSSIPGYAKNVSARTSAWTRPDGRCEHQEVAARVPAAGTPLGLDRNREGPVRLRNDGVPPAGVQPPVRRSGRRAGRPAAGRRDVVVRSGARS